MIALQLVRMAFVLSGFFFDGDGGIKIQSPLCTVMKGFSACIIDELVCDLCIMALYGSWCAFV